MNNSLDKTVVEEHMSFVMDDLTSLKERMDMLTSKVIELE
jgi:hypothetical protein